MKRLILVLACCLVGCGGSPSSSTAPSPVPQPAPAPPPTPFQGAWSGIWVRAACSETGGAVGVGCRALPTTGGLNLTLSQSGASASGSVTVGAFQLQASGPISAAQELNLTGSGKQSGATINIIRWSSTLSAPTVMTGSLVISIAFDDARVGTVTLTATLQGVVKN